MEPRGVMGKVWSSASLTRLYFGAGQNRGTALGFDLGLTSTAKIPLGMLEEWSREAQWVRSDQAQAWAD